MIAAGQRKRGPSVRLIDHGRCGDSSGSDMYQEFEAIVTQYLRKKKSTSSYDELYSDPKSLPYNPGPRVGAYCPPTTESCSFYENLSSITVHFLFLSSRGMTNISMVLVPDT